MYFKRNGMILNVVHKMQSLSISMTMQYFLNFQDYCNLDKSANASNEMQNFCIFNIGKWKCKNQYFLYFQYKGMKMQNWTNNLSNRPYRKHRNTIQAGHQEATTQTKIQGPKNWEKWQETSFPKINNGIASPHIAST